MRYSSFAAQVLRRAERAGLIDRDGSLLRLTERGRVAAQEAMVR